MAAQTTTELAEGVFACFEQKLPCHRVSENILLVNGRCTVNRVIHDDYLHMWVGPELPPNHSGTFEAELFDFWTDRTTAEQAEKTLMPWVRVYAGLKEGYE